MSEAQRLFAAIKADDISEVETLIRAEPALAAAVDSDGVSAVMLAVYYGRQNILDKLLACGIELNLWEASAVGQKERVIELLEQHPTVVNAFSPDGFTPLGLSVFFGHPAVMECLLARGAEVNLPSQNAMKVCPLHSAAAQHDPAMAVALTRRLLEEGAAPNVAQSGGWRPLHEAAARGDADLAVLLLRAGAEATIRNDEGKTPLDMARAGSHAQVIRLLERA